MRGFIAYLFFAVIALPASSHAKDYVSTQGALSDDAFYRLVACAAPPGGACERPLVRWPAHVRQELRIGVMRTSALFPDSAAARLALDRAIATINSANIGARFVESTKRPHVQVILSHQPAQSWLQDTGVSGLDGHAMDHAHVHIWWNKQREINRGAIVLSTSLLPSEYESVLLEELVQVLGLITDIDNPDYAGRSIFAADDNLTTTLRGQDLAALRYHHRN